VSAVSGRCFASPGEPWGPDGGHILRDACFASSSGWGNRAACDAV